MTGFGLDIWRSRRDLASFELRRSAEHLKRMDGLAKAHREALLAEQDRQKMSQQEMTEAHRKFMRDSTNFFSGELARERHEQEWIKRQAYEPALAVTLVEKRWWRCIWQRRKPTCPSRRFWSA